MSRVKISWHNKPSTLSSVSLDPGRLQAKGSGGQEEQLTYTKQNFPAGFCFNPFAKKKNPKVNFIKYSAYAV